MRRHLGELQAAVDSVPTGFRLLVDLTNLKSMSTACAPYIDQVMDLCNEKGVTKVVRIVPDSKKDIGLGIMSHFHYSRDVQIITCETADEATRALEG
jgi:anti-anti-sigma regulatory factor